MAVQVQNNLPPQTEREFVSINGSGQQIQNSYGGYVCKAKAMECLNRFLLTGYESNTYHTIDRQLITEHVQCIGRLIQNKHGPEVVQRILEVSEQRRSLKPSALLFAYALCARSNDKDTKTAAYSHISKICRTPTFLFMFIKFCEEISNPEGVEGDGTGWGRAHKRAISSWYTDFVSNPEKLARLVTKFKNRETWTHKDVLRLAHTSTNDKAIGFVLRYIVKGLASAKKMYCKPNQNNGNLENVVALLESIDMAMMTTDENKLCKLIDEYRLVREHCPSPLLKSPKVWLHLLKEMPAEAMIRNLGVMTQRGLFQEGSEDLELLLNKIRNLNTKRDEQESAPKLNQVHPFRILLALQGYKNPDGSKKRNSSWESNQSIVEALDEAFYKAFDCVEPTGKKFYLGVDVSGSMNTPVLGSRNIYCSTTAAAMMMVTARTEQKSIFKGFSDKMREWPINRDDKLDDVIRKMYNMPFGATDCAAPMMDAIEMKIKDIDCFVVYTDSETWCGKVHPGEALRQYRKYSGKNEVRLIVCGMCANQFTVADPDDRYMLNVVGFDSSVPRLITEFVK